MSHTVLSGIVAGSRRPWAEGSGRPACTVLERGTDTRRDRIAEGRDCGSRLGFARQQSQPAREWWDRVMSVGFL